MNTRDFQELLSRRVFDVPKDITLWVPTDPHIVAQLVNTNAGHPGRGVSVTIGDIEWHTSCDEFHIVPKFTTIPPNG